MTMTTATSCRTMMKMTKMIDNHEMRLQKLELEMKLLAAGIGYLIIFVTGIAIKILIL